MADEPRLLTFYPDKVRITQVADVEEGPAPPASVRDLLNQTWARQDKIRPKPEGRRVPRPLDVYELRPRPNCRSCGKATCMTFAFDLLGSCRRPEKCPALDDPAYAARRQALAEMLDQAEEGRAVPTLHAL